MKIVKDRITVMMDSDNVKKIRQIQAGMIRETQSSVSFSHVLNFVVNEGLKKLKI